MKEFFDKVDIFLAANEWALWAFLLLTFLLASVTNWLIKKPKNTSLT